MHFGCKYYKCRIVPRVTVSETGASRSWNCSRRFLSCFTYLRQTCAHCFITCKWSKCIQLRRNNQRWASSIRRACQWAAVNISGRPSRHMQLSHSQIQKKTQKQIIFFNPTDLNDMCSFYLNLFRTSSYYSGQHIMLSGYADAWKGSFHQSPHVRVCTPCFYLLFFPVCEVEITFWTCIGRRRRGTDYHVSRPEILTETVMDWWIFWQCDIMPVNENNVIFMQKQC